MFWFIAFTVIAVAGLAAAVVFMKSARGFSEEAAQKYIEDHEVPESRGYGREDRASVRREYRGNRDVRKLGTWVAFGVAGLGILLMPLTMIYSQDVGESKVQVSFTGNLVGQTTDTGLHFKAPWVNIRTFDVRNNVVSYIGGADEENVEHAGNPRTGPQITFQDREGVSGNMDVTVRYSLDPEHVTDIYSEYKTQDALVTRVINEAVRVEARESTVTRETIEVFNERSDLAVELREGLEDRITIEGFIIEDVSIQEIKYPASVEDRFNEAQAARIEIDRAEAAQQAAEVEAETKVIEAQGVADANVTEATGQAEANRLLSESLTDSILRQRYIDAISNGSTFVVPEGSDPLVSTK